MSEIEVDAFSVDISKNARETIRIQTKEYRGYDLVDIRIWIPGKDEELGEWIPTRQGVCFRCELLPDIVGPLQALLEMIPVEKDES